GRISCLVSQPSMPDPSRIGRNRPETKRATSTPMPTSTAAATMFGIAVNTAVSIAEAGSEIEAMPRICSDAIDTTIMISAKTTEARISGTFEAGEVAGAAEVSAAGAAGLPCDAGSAGRPALVTPPVALSKPDWAVPSSLPKSTAFSAVVIRARTIFAIVRPMMKTKTAPMMFGMKPRPCSSIEMTGESTCESSKIPRMMIRPSSQITIEAMVPIELPRAAPSTPGRPSAGTFCVSPATPFLTSMAKIAVMTRMTTAARIFSPSPAQSKFDSESTRSSGVRGCVGHRSPRPASGEPGGHRAGNRHRPPRKSMVYDLRHVQTRRSQRPPNGRSGPAEGHEVLPALSGTLEVLEAGARRERRGHRLQQVLHGAQVPQVRRPQRRVEVDVAGDVQRVDPLHLLRRRRTQRLPAPHPPRRGGSIPQQLRGPALRECAEEAGVVDLLRLEHLEQLGSEGGHLFRAPLDPQLARHALRPGLPIPVLELLQHGGGALHRAVRVRLVDQRQEGL